MEHLITLDMSNNELTSFDADDFIFPENLTNLIVHSNKLMHFSAKAFKNISLVKVIDLQNNSIESFDLELLGQLKSGLELFIAGKLFIFADKFEQIASSLLGSRKSVAL